MLATRTMTRLLAISAREYASFFRTPVGWILVALFLCLSSVFFLSHSLRPGAPASMRDFFSVWWGLLLFIAPAVSMRLIAEEHRSGTLEPFLAAPVSEAAIIAGKYLAALLMLLTMLTPTLLFPLILDSLARPDFGPILSGYLGLVLLGMLYLAVGTLASTLTSSQTLAFLGCLFALLLLDFLPARLAPSLPQPFNHHLASLSPASRIQDFVKGLIDTANIAYLLALSFWFLALAAILLQSKRWR